MSDFLNNHGGYSRFLSQLGAKKASPNVAYSWLHQQKIIREIGNLIPETKQECRELAKSLNVARVDEETITARVLRLHPEDLETCWRYIEAEEYHRAIQFIMKNRKRDKAGSGIEPVFLPEDHTNEQ